MTSPHALRIKTVLEPFWNPLLFSKAHGLNGCRQYPNYPAVPLSHLTRLEGCPDILMRHQQCRSLQILFLVCFSAELIPFACKHVFLQAWREMAVVPLNHANACAHLHSKRVYIHPVVEQGKGRIGVA